MNNTTKKVLDTSLKDAIKTTEKIIMKYNRSIIAFSVFAEARYKKDDSMYPIIGAAFQMGYETAKAELKEKKN